MWPFGIATVKDLTRRLARLRINRNMVAIVEVLINMVIHTPM